MNQQTLAIVSLNTSFKFIDCHQYSSIQELTYTFSKIRPSLHSSCLYNLIFCSFFHFRSAAKQQLSGTYVCKCAEKWLWQAIKRCIDLRYADPNCTHWCALASFWFERRELHNQHALSCKNKQQQKRWQSWLTAILLLLKHHEGRQKNVRLPPIIRCEIWHLIDIQSSQSYICCMSTCILRGLCSYARYTNIYRTY